VGRFCAEDVYDGVRRAFSHHGEIERASSCTGIDMLYGDYHVIHEVEAAPPKPLWGQEACKCSGRCSGAGVGIQDEN